MKMQMETSMHLQTDEHDEVLTMDSFIVENMSVFVNIDKIGLVGFIGLSKIGWFEFEN
jgi:hypothetical protein